jgi:chromosome partitioning protein
MATRMICIANQKGGVGKTTTAVNLAYGLAERGHPTLLVDSDPQANTSAAVLGRQHPELTIYDLLARDDDIQSVIMKTTQDHLDLLPSEIDLAGAEAEFIGQVGGQVLLRSKLKKLTTGSYEFIVLDTPPSLGLLTLNALAASKEVIIPISASFFALKGLLQLERTIKLVRDRLDNQELHILGVLCTFYDYTNVAKDVREAILERYNDRVFKTIIPKNVKLEEAHSRGGGVYEYASDCKGAVAYGAFVAEVLHRG